MFDIIFNEAEEDDFDLDSEEETEEDTSDDSSEEDDTSTDSEEETIDNGEEESEEEVDSTDDDESEKIESEFFDKQKNDLLFQNYYDTLDQVENLINAVNNIYDSTAFASDEKN